MATFWRMSMAAAIAVMLAGRAEADPFFTGLGDLAGGAQFSRAWAISADGTTVVGEGRSAGGAEAFRWTRGTGLNGLGDLGGGGFGSVAYGVSADGRVVVGAGTSAASGAGREAFRWTASGGMAGLGDLAGGPFESVAFGVSANGSVVVGVGSVSDPFSGFATTRAAVRWTSGGAAIANINPTSAGPANQSAAFGVSADGSVVAGRFTSGGAYNDGRAGAWTAAGGWAAYPGSTADIDRSGQARAVSADGSVLVGSTNAPPSALTSNSFVWDRVDGSTTFLHGVSAGDLASLRNTVANGVTADGGIVVGTINADGLPLDPAEMPSVSLYSRAFIWDEGGGFRLLQDVLAAEGFSMPGWTLLEALGISADGTAIAGTGVNPMGVIEAWYASLDFPIGAGGSPAVIPEPSTMALCLAGLGRLALALRARRRASSGHLRPVAGAPSRG